MLFPALSSALIMVRKIPTHCSEVSTDCNLFSLSMLLVCNYLNINVTMSCTWQVHEVRLWSAELVNLLYRVQEVWEQG